jgi:hypothetical protein
MTTNEAATTTCTVVAEDGGGGGSGLLLRRTVVYCGACGMPPEYCEYGTLFVKTFKTTTCCDAW